MSVKGPGTDSCPDCRKPVKYKTFVTIKAAHTEALQQGSSEDVQLSKPFGCPNCSNQVQVAYKLEIVEVRRFDLTASEPVKEGLAHQPLGMDPKAKSGPFSESELLQLSLCKSSGLFPVFVDVVKSQSNGHNPPANMDRYFVNFLRHMEIERLPRPMLREFQHEFGGHITYWCAQRVGMVVSDGKICRFVPRRSMGGWHDKRRSIPLNGVMLERSAFSMERLKKTSFGLVPSGSRLFIEALAHCSGDRGRVMRNVPIRRSPK